MSQLQIQEETEKTQLSSSSQEISQQELFDLLGVKSKNKSKKKLVLAAIILALLAALIVWKITKSSETEQNTVTYRQYNVARGNVVVGSTESSSISLNRETIKFPVSTTVEETFVKPGMSVQKGDPLIRLNLEEIEAGLITYQLEVKMAELELEQAKLDQKSKLLKAEQTYKNTLLAGELAESNQSITIAQLEKQLKTAQDNLEDALEDLHTYRNYEDNYDDDYSNIQALSRRVATYKDLYQNYESRYNNVVKWEAELANYESLYNGLTEEEKADTDEDSLAMQYKDKIATYKGLIGDDISAALLKSYQNAYEDYQSANRKYSERLADFNEEYDIEYGDDEALADRIKSLKDKVESYDIALQTAKNSQQSESLTAEQTKELTELSAQTALAQYNLTTLQLSQAVDQAQEIYDQTLRQIETIKKSISNDGIVYAPCTGMILSITLEEGDDFEVTYNKDTDTLNEQTLLTMTDISSVYVPVTISEEDILKIYIGQKATVTMNAFESQTFEAEVDTISAEVARSGAATVSYTVNIKYTDENKLNMYEGMSAQATLIQRVAEDVLYINNQAVKNQNGVATVQKLNKDGSTQTVTVKTGFSNGQYVEILEGLSEGDTVLAASGVGRP